MLPVIHSVWKKDDVLKTKHRVGDYIFALSKLQIEFPNFYPVAPVCRRGVEF